MRAEKLHLRNFLSRLTLAASNFFRYHRAPQQFKGDRMKIDRFFRGMIAAATFASTIAVAQDAASSNETPASPSAEAAPVAEVAAPEVVAVPEVAAPTEDATPAETPVTAHVLARFGDASTNSENVLFFYSGTELANPKFGLTGDLEGQVALKSLGKVDQYFVYRTVGSVDAKAYPSVIVSGDLAIGQRFVDTVTLSGESTANGLKVEPLSMVACLQPEITEPMAVNNYAEISNVNAAATFSYAPSVQQAPAQNYYQQAPARSYGQLDQHTIMYGASWIDPNTLAQARAQYMAERGMTGHLGSGRVLTNQGYLSEGTGKSWGTNGASTPSTCTATNGSAAVGDGIAHSGNSATRVRLYNSNGTQGSSGGGFFRRR
jgi:hypothetical protein